MAKLRQRIFCCHHALFWGVIGSMIRPSPRGNLQGVQPGKLSWDWLYLSSYLGSEGYFLCCRCKMPSRDIEIVNMVTCWRYSYLKKGHNWSLSRAVFEMCSWLFRGLRVMQWHMFCDCLPFARLWGWTQEYVLSWDWFATNGVLSIHLKWWVPVSLNFIIL